MPVPETQKNKSQYLSWVLLLMELLKIFTRTLLKIHKWKNMFLLATTNFPQNVWLLIANFTSANVCLSDEFENYCFIKRILSLKEAYVWGRICIEWYISHTRIPRQCLLSSRSPHLGSTLLPKFGLFPAPDRGVSVCKLGTVQYIICTLFTSKRDERDSPLPALNEVPVLCSQVSDINEKL